MLDNKSITLQIVAERYYAPKEVITQNGGILPISLSGLYAAIGRGDIPSIKIGHRIFVPGSYLVKLIA